MGVNYSENVKLMHVFVISIDGRVPVITAGNSNGVKIRISLKSLGTRLLRTTGLIEIP